MKSWEINIYSLTKILVICIINILVLPIANSKSEKQRILIDLLSCLESKDSKKCADIISRIEKKQIKEYEKGNFKCQTSLLGAQTEVIQRIYFESNIKNSLGFTIPFVIKNC